MNGTPPQRTSLLTHQEQGSREYSCAYWKCHVPVHVHVRVRVRVCVGGG